MTCIKMIKEVVGQKICSLKGCINFKKGMLIIEIEKIPQQWKKLFYDSRRAKTTLHKNIQRLVVLQSEIRVALAKMNRNKATQLDVIVIEKIPALNDLWIDKITEIVNEIHDNSKMLKISVYLPS